MEITGNSFYTALRGVIERGLGDKIALIDGEKSLTFIELLKATDIAAKELSDIGVSDGEHVAIWSYNSINWIITFLSILKLGAVAVLMNFSTQLPDMEHLLLSTDVKYIAYGNNREMKGDTGPVKALAKDIGISENCLYDITYRNDLISKVRNSDTVSSIRQCTDLTEKESREKPAFIIFTTGTTSEPKAVVLAQYGYINDARDLYTLMSGILDDTACFAIPFFHCFGLVSTLLYLFYGCTVSIVRSFIPDHVAEAVYRSKASVIVTVGVVLAKLVEHPDFETKVSPYVKLCVTGGGALTQTQLLRLETSFADTRVVNGYGQTESSTVISITMPYDTAQQRSSTVGRPLRSKTVRISDGKGGFLPSGSIGEIVLLDEGNLMKRYYGLAQEQQAIDKDGYLHTGDLGFIDQDGFLHLSGRLKDIIIKGGENISPTDVEKALMEIENISDAKVMGAHHPIYGESVEACVTCFNKTLFNAETLKNALKKILAPYKIPSHIFLYDDFPLNANNKLDQRTLKADMLTRLHKVNIAEALDEGMRVFSLSLKNTAYNIAPVSIMVENLASAIGFNKTKASHVALAVEEFLSERIVNAYSNIGDIDVSVIFMSEWLRIQFTDNGEAYDIYKNRESSLSAKLVLKMVDSFSVLQQKNGRPAYSLDFLYHKEFDISKFLLLHERSNM